ncbi:MAG: 16S rRNA (cytosine(967)-C(5))-methyltransferase RsmB, partial [Bacillota bacterium]|nr:16S rRNA (cytosine(967)-C(5))-methyltransferase RsmB [Bacillota bacterium]
ARDRRFAAALIYETLSYTYTIDWILRQVSKRPLASLDPWIRTVLRMGVWQLTWSRSIPVSAAIDESVRIAASRTNRGAAGYVNAVLRNLARNPVEIPDNVPLLTGLPPELYGHLRKWYGDEEARKLACQSLESVRTVTARTNRLRITPEALCERLSQDGVICEPGRYCPEALAMHLSGQPVSGLAAWRDGLLSIQNEAAMLVGHAAGPRQGWSIIDLCAAPGGKTTHLAELAGGQADILAVDSHEERLHLVTEQAKRLGLDGIRYLVADSATGLDPAGKPAFMPWQEQADLVLADVPCSGLGLLGRKPEIRLHMTHERIGTFYPLQAAILDTAARLVRPGGVLIYSTCTINPAENDGQVDAFLQRHGGLFQSDPLTELLPLSLLDQDDLADQAARGRLQLLPHRHGTDGFFMARMKKVD